MRRKQALRREGCASQISLREPTGGDSWFSPGLERKELEQRERQ